MKLDRLQEYLTIALVLMLGAGFALFCGSQIGSGQSGKLGLIFTAMFITALCLSMRASVWLLIPLCWELTGKIPALDIPLGVRDIAVLVAFGAYLFFYALKLVRTKPTFDLLDGLVMLNLLYLASVFVRNPVGAKWLGSDMVGGRPYFDNFVAFLAFCVVTRAPVDLKAAARFPVMLLIGSAFVSLGSLLTYLVPSSAGVLGNMYSVFAPKEIRPGSIMPEDVIGRKPGLLVVGISGVKLLCSYFRPLTLVSPLYGWRFLAAGLVFVTLLLSGFRSGLVATFAYVCISSYFRRQSRDIFMFLVAGGLALSVAALGNSRLFTLPFAAQRALSFLPGEWDYEAAKDAKGSTQWRFEIWEMVLTEDKWIRNKFLGDGFGFTRYELSLMESLSGFGDTQEAFMVAGTYHSGPLSAIRYAGFVGLALYLTLIGYLAMRAYRLIIASRGGALFPVALLVGMPLIYKPLDYVFIFGGYDSSLPESVFMAGMVKLLERWIATAQAESPTHTDAASRFGIGGSARKIRIVARPKSPTQV